MESCLHWRTDIFSEHSHFANFLGVPCCLRMSAVVPMCVGKQSCLHNLPPTVTPDRYFKTSVPYPLHASQPRRGWRSCLPAEGCSGLPKASILRVLLCSSHGAPEALEPCGLCQSICDIHRGLEELMWDLWETWCPPCLGTWMTTTMSNKPQTHSFLPLLSLTPCTPPHKEASCRASYWGILPQYLSVGFDCEKRSGFFPPDPARGTTSCMGSTKGEG